MFFFTYVGFDKVKIVLLFKIQPLLYLSDRRKACILQNKSMKISRLVKRKVFSWCTQKKFRHIPLLLWNMEWRRIDHNKEIHFWNSNLSKVIQMYCQRKLEFTFEKPQQPNLNTYFNIVMYWSRFPLKLQIFVYVLYVLVKCHLNILV